MWSLGVQNKEEHILQHTTPVREENLSMVGKENFKGPVITILD